MTFVTTVIEKVFHLRSIVVPSRHFMHDSDINKTPAIDSHRTKGTGQKGDRHAETVINIDRGESIAGTYVSLIS